MNNETGEKLLAELNEKIQTAIPYIKPSHEDLVSMKKRIYYIIQNMLANHPGLCDFINSKSGIKGSKNVSVSIPIDRNDFVQRISVTVPDPNYFKDKELSDPYVKSYYEKKSKDIEKLLAINKEMNPVRELLEKKKYVEAFEQVRRILNKLTIDFRILYEHRILMMLEATEESFEENLTESYRFNAGCLLDDLPEFVEVIDNPED